jgi:hypothetical protein
MLDFLYEPDERDRAIFGKFYIEPGVFPHAEEVLVARYPKDGGDGQPCEICECRLPARFYTLKALESSNSIGNVQPAYEIGTGSGDEIGRLIHEFAIQAARGMIAVRVQPKVSSDAADVDQ